MIGVNLPSHGADPGDLHSQIIALRTVILGLPAEQAKKLFKEATELADQLTAPELSRRIGEAIGALKGHETPRSSPAVTSTTESEVTPSRTGALVVKKIEQFFAEPQWSSYVTAVNVLRERGIITMSAERPLQDRSEPVNQEVGRQLSELNRKVCRTEPKLDSRGGLILSGFNQILAKDKPLSDTDLPQLLRSATDAALGVVTRLKELGLQLRKEELSALGSVDPVRLKGAIMAGNLLGSSKRRFEEHSLHSYEGNTLIAEAVRDINAESPLKAPFARLNSLTHSIRLVKPFWPRRELETCIEKELVHSEIDRILSGMGLDATSSRATNIRGDAKPKLTLIRLDELFQKGGLPSLPKDAVTEEKEERFRLVHVITSGAHKQYLDAMQRIAGRAADVGETAVSAEPSAIRTAAEREQLRAMCEQTPGRHTYNFIEAVQASAPDFHNPRMVAEILLRLSREIGNASLDPAEFSSGDTAISLQRKVLEHARNGAFDLKRLSSVAMGLYRLQCTDTEVISAVVDAAIKKADGPLPAHDLKPGNICHLTWGVAELSPQRQDFFAAMAKISSPFYATWELHDVVYLARRFNQAGFVDERIQHPFGELSETQLSAMRGDQLCVIAKALSGNSDLCFEFFAKLGSTGLRNTTLSFSTLVTLMATYADQGCKERSFIDAVKVKSLRAPERIGLEALTELIDAAGRADVSDPHFFAPLCTGIERLLKLRRDPYPHALLLRCATVLHSQELDSPSIKSAFFNHYKDHPSAFTREQLTEVSGCFSRKLK